MNILTACQNLLQINCVRHILRQFEVTCTYGTYYNVLPVEVAVVSQKEAEEVTITPDRNRVNAVSYIIKKESLYMPRIVRNIIPKSFNLSTNLHHGVSLSINHM